MGGARIDMNGRGRDQGGGLGTAVWVLAGLVVVAFLAAVAFLVVPRVVPLPRPPAATVQGRLQVTAIDVGQGDAIFVRGPAGRTMLVDGGAGSEIARTAVLPYLRSQGVTRLDYVVSTHPDQDHVGGLPEVVRTMPVGAIVFGVLESTNQAHVRLLELAEQNRLQVIKARRGGMLDLGPGVQTRIINPGEPLLAEDNDNSVVLRISFGQVHVLLTGDAERQAEQSMLRSDQPLQAQILKVSHHGSQTGSSEAFLRAVQPKIALISAGRGNRFGHPRPEVLQRLQAVGAAVYRTDQHGTITIITNGSTWTVQTDR
jgi:competence protein ComEC